MQSVWTTTAATFRMLPTSSFGDGPVFTIRPDRDVEGIAAQRTDYDTGKLTMDPGATMDQVIGRKGSQ
jgi:hypothetical protein